MARHWGSKVDGNHARIKKELRAVGLKVLDLSGVGDGCPDLLVARGDKQLLVEVKTERGKLTDEELAFFNTWPIGMAIVARCAEDVLREFDMI